MSDPQKPTCLRVLIVEDTPERQDIMRSLFKDHAWILVHTAARAIRLINAYDFDLICLDYNIAGPDTGDRIAAAITESRNNKTQILVHSMNPQGRQKIVQSLPEVWIIPISKITQTNSIFKRFRNELSKGLGVINGSTIFSKNKYVSF